MHGPGELDAELLRGVFEVAPDAVVVVDAEGRIAMANPQCLEVFGHRPEELIGQPVEILVPLRFRDGHPQRRSGFVGAEDERQMGQLQLTAARRNGTVFPAEISLSTLRADGQRFVAATVRDVSARRHAEERFRGLLEAAPDATVIVDATATIVLTNNQVEHVFGYQRGELIGQRIEVLVPARWRSLHTEQRDGYLARPSVRQMGSGLELYAVRKDGTEFPVEISLSPLATDEGMLVSAAVRDVSERHRMQVEADRVREELFATVSHELRTPLSSILGYAEVMADLGEDELGPAARRMLAIIERNAERELRLVNDLLMLASLGKEQLTVAGDWLDLDRLVGASVESARLLARNRGVSLEFHGARLPMLWGDAQRLDQVTDNLLTNAVKFTPPGGRVQVRLGDREGELAVVEVQDTGAGMSEDELSRIFDRLFRASSAVQDQVPGAGLGLSVVKAIVSAHGGSLEASSAPGVGTTIRVLLPYLPGPGSDRSPDPDP